jgi:prolyl 4-hydroxylase
MKEHAVNQLDNFIGGWYLDDTSICDEITEFFKHSPDQVPGTFGQNYSKVNIAGKDSTDVYVEWRSVIGMKYFKLLNVVAQEYIKKYPYCDTFAKWGLIQPFNIQYYKPGGGFYDWHTERSSTIMPLVTRHLAFMTYLNDVTDDGETEFFHQKLKVKPEKGLTLIWPVDWTLTHRGIPSMSQEKYITTGWFNYL